MHPRLLLPPVALLTGCLQLTCEDLAATPATVEVGVGETSFSPVASGAVVDVAFGPQGGQHVWGALRTTGLLPGGGADDAPEVHVWIHDDEGTVANWGPGRWPLNARTSGGDAEMTGLTVELTASPWFAPFLYPDDFDPETAMGEDFDRAIEAGLEELNSRPWTLSATAADVCGVSASADVPVRIEVDSVW